MREMTPARAGELQEVPSTGKSMHGHEVRLAVLLLAKMR